MQPQSPFVRNEQTAEKWAIFKIDNANARLTFGIGVIAIVYLGQNREDNQIQRKTLNQMNNQMQLTCGIDIDEWRLWLYSSRPDGVNLLLEVGKLEKGQLMPKHFSCPLTQRSNIYIYEV